MSSNADYTLLAKRLKKNIGKYRIHLPQEYNEEGQMLPVFPMTEVRGNNIVIIWDEHEEQIWDHDEGENDLLEVAKEIELELRAIKYVKLKFIHNISEFERDLREFNVSEDHVGDLIYSAYSSLKKLFVEMECSRLGRSYT